MADEQEKQEEVVVEEVVDENDNSDEGKIDYAKKWFIACIVLFAILIILFIILQILPHDSDLWSGGPVVSQ